MVAGPFPLVNALLTFPNRLYVLLEAGPAQPRLPRHRLLLGSRRPCLRDQRHRVEVAVHALGEAHLVGIGAVGWHATVAGNG